jgi:hypothetical protein
VNSGRGFSPRCFFVAWVAGWCVAVYLPSAAIALTGLSPLAAGRNPASATFAVADQVAPAAKILFALLFGLMLLAARRFIRSSPGQRLATDMLAACIATLLVLAFLPAEWSRGFGIGLTGKRFAALPLLIYLAGALLAGLSFSLSERRCERASRPG